MFASLFGKVKGGSNNQHTITKKQWLKKRKREKMARKSRRINRK